MFDKLPLCVVPQPGELLSSWLFRLSYSHYQKTYSFYKNEFEIVSGWIRDIDRSVSDDFIAKLAVRTPYTHNEILQMSLRSYNEFLYLKDNPLAVNKWILSAGFRSRTIKNGYLNYCPTCFHENRIFFRREWRLALFNTCSFCGTFLRNKCPHCNRFVSTFRSDIGRKTFHFNLDMSHCGYCERSLSPVPGVKAPDHLIRMENVFRKILDDGFQTDFKHSFIYFDVLYHLVQRILIFEGYQGRKTLQHFSHEQRSMLIFKSADLLEDFPNCIVPFAKANFLSASFWLKDYRCNWFLFSDCITKEVSKLRLGAF